MLRYKTEAQIESHLDPHLGRILGLIIISFFSSDAALAKSSARLSHIHGRVEIVRSTRHLTAKKETNLRSNDIVRTSHQSGALIQMAGTTIRLGKNSTLKILSTSRSNPTYKLLYGSIHLETDIGRISLPSGVLSLKKASAVIHVCQTVSDFQKRGIATTDTTQPSLSEVLRIAQSSEVYSRVDLINGDAWVKTPDRETVELHGPMFFEARGRSYDPFGTKIAATELKALAVAHGFKF